MSNIADLMLRGGRVYTVDAARSWAQAVAVRDGRIVAVGTDTQVGELAGASTQMIDLADRMLLPGFIDAHVHASAAGLERLRCDLSDAHRLDDYLAIVRRYAQSSLAAGSGGSSPQAGSAGGSGGSSPGPAHSRGSPAAGGPLTCSPVAAVCGHLDIAVAGRLPGSGSCLAVRCSRCGWARAASIRYPRRIG
jgi:hypothetical protein